MLHRFLLLASCAVASPALAQVSPDSGAPAVDAGAEIVVTAQLREQDAQDVPIAVTAITDEQFKRLGLVEFEQVSRFVPGFFVQNQSPNNPGFVVRGITSDSGTAYNEPRVSVYQDGVSIAKSRGSYVELFDVERLEVAKGPQSTLYGRGALIGAINIIQNKADPDRTSAFARGSYGNYDSYLGEGMVNLATGNGGAIRVAGRIRERDGFIENLLGGRDFASARTWAVRGSAHQEVGDFTLDLIGNYQKDTPAGTPFKSIAYRPTDPVTGAVIGDAGRNSGAALAPGAGLEGGRPLGLRREVGGITGIATWDFSPALRLTSITAYREFDALEVFDADGISLPVLTAAEDAHSNQASQELRLTYDSDRVTAFIGGSYFFEDGYQRTPAQFDERVLLARLTNLLAGPIPGRPATDPAPAAVFANTAFTSALLQGVAGASGIALPSAQAAAIAANLRGNYLETSTNLATTNAFDLFGDVTFRIGDRFEIGGGIRYTHDSKESGFTSAVLGGRSVLGGFIAALGLPAAQRAQLLGGLALPGAGTSLAIPLPVFGLGAQPTAGNGQVQTAELDNGGFSWRGLARYELSDQASLYGSYARGRRPQVLVASAPSAPFAAARFNRLPSETVDSFELGLKTALLNRRLFLDASGFYYKYNNFQTTEQQGTTFVTTNAGEAESYGVETQGRWNPTADISVFATYAYNHSRFQSGIRDGNRFRLSPDHAASFGAIVGVPLGADAGRITLTPSVTWQSRVYFDDDNDLPALQQPPRALVADNLQDETQSGYALVNARVGYEAPGGWQIEAFVENAFDKEYINDAGNTGDGLGLPTFIAGNPRFYGVAATLRFGGGR
ncbi:Outer membrane receptor proteins, mostly Fe transport [Sphingomonas guangdongensis]|uniref:Outer membrane receptor proteins, mostly Fe transport n=1 Tax=Sphingomonas guangdongensis TaxID=1141890 RepID=A0A285R4I2_9SPHN|nr:TonB-dependent receptor [Sphingomonas guangdongensis]SOB87267.1 Outer membrane receptor proteins, mostly Fe transport [Sphingomonas guangdongensis]